MSVNRNSRRPRRPATTPDGRENQLISLASDLAEKQLVDGTASSQVLTHFLKLASSRERLEQERLQNENLLLSAKVDQIRSGQKIEELYGLGGSPSILTARYFRLEMKSRTPHAVIIRISGFRNLTIRFFATLRRPDIFFV